MILHLLISWLVLSLIVLATAALLPGFRVRGFGGAVIVAMLFGLFNVLIGWLLFVAIGIGTLVDAVSKSLEIKSFGWALGAAALMSALSLLADFAMRAL